MTDNLVWDEPIADEDLNKVVDKHGDIHYYKKGTNIIHRAKSPAAIYIIGSKFWIQNDKYHRLAGPAHEYSDGRKYWFYKGKWVDCSSQEEFDKFIRLQSLKAFW